MHYPALVVKRLFPGGASLIMFSSVLTNYKDLVRTSCSIDTLKDIDQTYFNGIVQKTVRQGHTGH